ncbi:MAG: bifunctional phosphoribosylaminoimidazolecarboxamide formyltransferase/IMP cyclohydrolase [Pyrinomonadaceae bacterium]
MTNSLQPIERALISVSDKTGIVEFARALADLKIEIVSTGGTAATLKEAGVPVRDVADLTGFPEMMDGRVKTLHPKVHGGLLAIRDNEQHRSAMEAHAIERLDLVVVNLYPFERTIKREGVTRDEAVEQIDIGGPAMIRSAAKNAKYVAVVIDPAQYPAIIEELKKYSGALTLQTRDSLARHAFAATSQYDRMISSYLCDAVEEPPANAASPGSEAAYHAPARARLPPDVEDIDFPPEVTLSMRRIATLRYGENPHQHAALYQTKSGGGITNAQLLSGKGMSFNNYVDADAAWQLVLDFENTGCAIVKHTNPAGAAIASTTSEAYRKALATDPVSAFGGIVAFNRKLDAQAAAEVVKIFTEVVVAPDYDAEALAILQAKKNLRILRAVAAEATGEVAYKQISGGMLMQTADAHKLTKSDLKFVSHKQPTDAEIGAMLFAWTVCKHTKSNAIVYAHADQTVGVGAGQMSRVDSVKIGAMRAQLPLAGCVLASDAFFPFRDGIDEAAKYGISAVIQPGGSVRDEEVIAAANEHGIAMVFTGVRHFKH